MPKVSVIIPVYNVEKYLKRCLDSVINQTLKDIEIICINDASTDESLAILQEYVSKDNRIKLINISKNKGASYARNIGIDNATGGYIGFIDSDDFIDLNFYEKLYFKAKENNADAVKGNIYNYDENTQQAILTDFYNMNNKIRKNKTYFYYGFTSAIYKKKFLDKYKIRFPKNISYFEDPYFSIKACLNYKKLYFDDSAIYYYSQHNQNSVSNHATIHNFENFKKIGLKTIDLLNKSKISKKSYNIIFNFLFNFAEENYYNISIDNELREYLFKILVEFLFLSKYNYKLPKRFHLQMQNKILNKNYYDLLLKYYKRYDYLNKKNSIVKIFVSYIKPSFLFKTKILTPIHLGRSVEKEESKDGIVSSDDIKWLHKNCIGDDDFPGNISSLNRRIGFLTGTYWAWKNYEKLGNPKYFGSMGYRKLLFPNSLENIEKYDFITPVKMEFKESLKQQFITSHGKDYYNMMVDTLQSVYPNEINNFNKYFKMHSGYFAEMYILKKDLFFDFCNWIFPLLNYLVSKYQHFIEPSIEADKVDVLLAKFIKKDIADLNINKSEIRDFRDIAFIIERYTGFYIYKLTKKSEYNYKESNVFEPIIQLTSFRKSYKNLMLEQMRNNVRTSFQRK